jgi:DNA invertase Pin-like site-specific DNA recombinase
MVQLSCIANHIISYKNTGRVKQNVQPTMSHTNKFIIYKRVSGGKNQKSGLGLDAQTDEINIFLQAQTNYQIVSEHTEVKSGKSHEDRPELIAAMDIAEKTNATILVSRLCRLSRDLEFVARLMKNPKINFKVATHPTADNFTLAIYATMNMRERELISIRTKNALRMARKRGTKLGITGKENIKHANKERILKANQFAKNISHLIIPMKRSGMSSRKIADALNASKVTTPQGKLWGNRQVLRLLERIDYQPA